MQKLWKSLNKKRTEICVLLFAILFSTWLTSSTFFYHDQSIQIASKAWSDFASHIPLIRSFSFGDNFPPQYPLFSGPNIKYHFLFYAFVGVLEKLGLRIDYALNIPSALGFSFLIIMIFLLSKELFKSTFVSILSILFFLFHGSLDFINFFLKYPLSLETLSQILNNSKFISFGPYDGNIISAFWNLNIYTNQRHLGLSYGLSLFIIYLFLRFKQNHNEQNLKKTFLIGIILGFSFLLNMAVFLMTVLVLICFLLFFTKIRRYILISLILGFIIFLPQYLFIQSYKSSSEIILHFGYLISNLNLLSFINYWFQNLGLHLVLIPLAFIFSNGNQKKIFLSFLGIFILGNILQFSPDIAANHKFFNYFMIIGAMFSAYILLKAWNLKTIVKPFVIIMIFILTISGVINFFPIFNDSTITMNDYPKNKNVYWIIKNTKPDSVFLNNRYLYDDASIAGRKIFLGWPYFAWSQGYDTLSRDNLRKELLISNDLSSFCSQVINNNIDYVDIHLGSDDTLVNLDFFNKNFNKVFENNQDKYIIYEIGPGC